MTNDSEFGLAGYFHARDLARVGGTGVQHRRRQQRADRQRDGTFGGFKQSGMGREGSKYGIEDYLEIKYVCMAGIR